MLDNPNVWVDAAGVEWAPEEMTPSHRSRALAFAQRNVARMYLRHCQNNLRLAIEWWSQDLTDSVLDAAERAIHEADAELDLARTDLAEFHRHASQWLASLPVILRLYELTATDRANRTIEARRQADNPELMEQGWWETTNEVPNKESNV